jgi:transposase
MKENRRKFSSSYKAEVALEAVKGMQTISEIAHHYELHPVQVSQWKKEFIEHSAEVFEGDRKQKEELERHRNERDQLYRHIGELKVENDWFKKKLQ